MKELLVNSGLLYASGFFSILLTFIQQITTANRLGPTDYGRFAIVLSSSFLVTVIMDFRTWELGAKLLAVPIEQQQHQESVRIISWLNLIELLSGVVGGLLVFALAHPIAVYLLQAPDVDWLVRLYALSIPFRVITMGILGVIPRLFDHFDWLAAKSVAYAFLRLILISGAAWLGFGLPGVVMAAVITEVAHLVMLIVMALVIKRQHLPHTPLIDLIRPQQFSEARKMIGAFWLNSTLLGIHIYAFIPAMALFTTPTQIGLFRSGMDIAELIDRAVQPLLLVIWPKIITLYAPEHPGAFRRYLLQAAGLMNLVCLPLMVGIMLGIPLLLPHILSNEGFKGVVPVAVALTFGYGIYLSQFWTRPAIITTGLIGFQNWHTFALLIVSLALLIWLTPQQGAFGGALARMSFLVLSSLSSILLLQSKVPLFRFRKRD